jgi:hypothetical protein
MLWRGIGDIERTHEEQRRGEHVGAAMAAVTRLGEAARLRGDEGRCGGAHVSLRRRRWSKVPRQSLLGAEEPNVAQLRETADWVAGPRHRREGGGWAAVLGLTGAEREQVGVVAAVG